jgi:hypothetical protein
MCLPALAALAPALSAIGAGVGVVGAVSAGIAQSQQSKANAKVAEYQAVQADERGALERSRLRDRINMTIGAGRAGWGASGVALGAGGSPLNWETSTAALGAQDLEISKYNTELEKWGYRTQAASYRASASNQMGQAIGSGIGGGLSFAGTMLSSASQNGLKMPKWVV